MGVGRIAKRRLAAVVMTAAIAACATEFLAVFSADLPAGAGIDELWLRLQTAVVRSINGIVSAMVGAVLGFFVRADKAAPWSVLQDNQK